jgi:long-subunit fatty acid transport protein
MRLNYRIPATVDLEGIGVLSFVISGTAHYTPHTLNFGAAFDVTDNFTISAEGQWQNWSAAPSPYVGILIDLSGPTLDALGLGSALDVQSAIQKPGFVDTLGGRLGAEYRVTERFAVRAGGFLRPTPVPKQDTKGTNLMDNTTVGFSAGIGFNFPDPLEIFQHPIQIDLTGQSQFVLAREAKKGTTDNQAAYTYSANVYGVSGALRYDF